jgi:hypothetical protein
MSLGHSLSLLFCVCFFSLPLTYLSPIPSIHKRQEFGKVIGTEEFDPVGMRRVRIELIKKTLEDLHTQDTKSADVIDKIGQAKVRLQDQQDALAREVEREQQKSLDDGK